MKHLSNVMIYFIPSITYQIYAVLDKAMLGWLVGSNYENGYYEQANKIVNLVVNVISSYTIVMRSRIGTCPLIWNDDGEKAEEIRRFVDIPWSEQIVAIIQVGHYATNECKYAASNRRAVFDVLKIH